MSTFPIAYSFNEEQLKKALEKLGARKEECVTYLGMGDVMKRTDVPAFKKMLVRHHDEMTKTLKNDKEFAEAAFFMKWTIMNMLLTGQAMKMLWDVLD